jgi:hypothetical protein
MKFAHHVRGKKFEAVVYKNWRARENLFEHLPFTTA